MKIALLDEERLIRVNQLKECTSAALFSTGGSSLHDPHGILSDEIFGLNSKERRATFAYVDLGMQFFHPHIYNAIIKRLASKLVSAVNGTQRYKIVEGKLIEDENGWTGLKAIYDHWDAIDWSQSTSKNERSLKILKLSTRDEIFVSKWIISPAGYREVMAATEAYNSDKIVTINKLYQKLIRLTGNIGKGSTLESRRFIPQAEVQNLLVEIYKEFQGQLRGKTGYIKRHLMGKAVSFGTRAVISAPSYNKETMADNMVSIERAAIPIAQCCATFYPFIVAWVKNFFLREVSANPNIVSFYNLKTNQEVYGSIKDPEVQFSEKVIEKYILNFARNPDSRFAVIPIEVELSSGKKKDSVIANMMLVGKRMLPNNQLVDLKRPITITDILYLACVDICERRHVKITRYPVGTDKSNIFCKVRVQSTNTHIHIIFNGTDYPFYPDVKLDTPLQYVGVQFIDTCVFSNSMAAGLGADFDGDSISISSLWSEEANAEADKLMNQKTTALDILSGNTRTVSREIYNSFYSLTKIGKIQKVVGPLDQSKYLALPPDGFTRSVIIGILADTVDSSQGNQTKKRIAKYQPWDTFTVPANYFYKKQPEIKTTIGRFLFNKYILQGAGVIEKTQFVDSILDKSGLNALDKKIGNLYLEDLIDRPQFNQYIDRRDNLGYWLSGMITNSINLNTSKPLKQVLKRKAELVKQYEKEIAAQDIATMTQIEKELLDYAKEILKDDPAMDLYASGDLDFTVNYKNNFVIRGPIKNQITQEYDFIDTALSEGMKVEDQPAHANSIVANVYPGALATPEAGYLGKKLLSLLQMAEVDSLGSDCGTKNLIPIKVQKNNLDALTYRYFQKGKNLEMLTPENISSYLNRTLNFRSPMSCLTPKFCNKCIGELPYKLDIEQIGLYSVQLSFSDLNLNLKAKHRATIDLTYLEPDKIIEEI